MFWRKRVVPPVKQPELQEVKIPSYPEDNVAILKPVFKPNVTTS
jgi:hypothetical protein